VRALVPDDIDVVVEFSLRAWAPVFESFRTILGERVFQAIYPDWLASQASAVATICRDEAADVFVVEVQGRPVGYVAVVFHDEGAVRCGEIEMVAVDPDQQNCGLGTALTDLAVEHIRAAGCVLAVIGTGGDPGHAAARYTYEKAGFTALPTVRYYKWLV
jgi:GNAT superfamily N-acetyltransferase